MSRVGQVWEDQADRIVLVIGTRPARRGSDTVHHECLRLKAGVLSGTVIELPEFDDIPWEAIWERLA